MSDTDTDISDIDGRPAITLNQSDVEAAQTLLLLSQSCPHPTQTGNEISETPKHSNMPAAMRAGAPPGQGRSQVVENRVKERGTGLKRDVAKPKPSSRKKANRKQPDLEAANHAAASQGASGHDPPAPAATNQVAVNHATALQADAIQSVLDQLFVNTVPAHRLLPNQAAVNQAIAHHVAANRPPIPAVGNLIIHLHTCGHAHMEFGAITNGPVVEPIERPCTSLLCQAANPPRTFFEAYNTIDHEGQIDELKRLRAELGIINAVLGQTCFRLEFQLTGGLELGPVVREKKEEIGNRVMQLPVTAALLRLVQTTAGSSWWRHGYLLAARFFLERAQFHFRVFVNSVDNLCRADEGHLTPAQGRFSAVEIESLGTIFPARHNGTETQRR